MQPASAGGSVRLAMSSVYATSKCMLDYYRKGNMARDEPQLVRAYGRKNFDPVIKEWKWPDFGNVTITLARTEGLKNFDPDAEITSWDRMKVYAPCPPQMTIRWGGDQQLTGRHKATAAGAQGSA